MGTSTDADTGTSAGVGTCTFDVGTEPEDMADVSREVRWCINVSPIIENWSADLTWWMSAVRTRRRMVYSCVESDPD